MKAIYTKELDIRYTADVLVVGGGPAGVAAAVSASRAGASVIILERSGSFGGSSAIAGVPELMNFDDGEKFLPHGVGRAIFDRLGYKESYERRWYNVNTEALKRIYDGMLLDAGVVPLLYTALTDVIMEGKRIKFAVVSGADGSYAISARSFVDATGSGFLSMLAGAEYDYGDENGVPMSATLCSLWGGVDFAKKGTDGDYYESAYRDGLFSQYDPILPGIKANFPELGVGGGNVGHSFAIDDRSTEALTEATMLARKRLTEYERFYREYVDGCGNATLLRSADYIGIRESRRIRCEYTITTDDFFNSGSFPDEIGRYSYPVDIHPMSSDKEGEENFLKAISMRHSSGESYSIPYRCLVVKGLDNLLVAGRSIGADRGMQASMRVIPCCYITGQAAGIGAALSAELEIPARLVAYGEIKKILNTLTS